MSETPIDQPAADEPETPVADTPQEPVETATETEPDLAAEVAKWKALSKKNEQRAKENADKAKRFDELEEANKTELQKLLDRAEKAERAAEEARIGKLRSDVARETGVPAELIHGGTEEEMRAAAEVALAFKGNAKPSPAAPAKIVTSNGDTTRAKQITSRDELKSMTPQQILAAQKEGRLDELMGKST
ncbi:hypothetical protein [Nocardia sp. CC227C]|uniref:hypothetical protein n=1 Tax=Nocardia sp. CC227C TaxID=3044562 RepID=UPI00278C3AF4|nr:hypothetical protein [Nocardia sp. CC227C]